MKIVYYIISIFTQICNNHVQENPRGSLSRPSSMQLVTSLKRVRGCVIWKFQGELATVVYPHVTVFIASASALLGSTR